MPDLVVIIPTRGRPGTVPEIIGSFLETCRADTRLIFAVDESDPVRGTYCETVLDALYGRGKEMPKPVRAEVNVIQAVSMVDAMNKAAGYVLDDWRESGPRAIAFMGDDHRPRTQGWDVTYLETLRFKPGLVYGNDLLQGKSLPTQVAISASVVRALGHMAPDVLTHLYVDDYWKALGTAAGCITYLPEIVVEHLHPSAGKAQWDEGYRRVNDSAMYEHDGAAYGRYWAEHGSRDVERVKFAISRERGHGAQQV